MSDENTGDTPGEQTAGDAGQQQQQTPDPQYVTADQFKDMQDSLFSMVRKMSTQQPAPPKQPDPKRSDKPADAQGQELADMRAELDFMKMAPEGMPTDSKSAMFDLYRVQQPAAEDAAAWFEKTSRLFKSQEMAQVKPQDNSTPQPPPASDAGAPKATSANETDPNNVMNWTEEDYSRQFNLKAKVPHNRYDVRNREFYREVRRNAERQMANTKIQLGGGRKG